MNIEMQRELYERYPLSLRRPPGHGGRPYPIDLYGIECGDGWHGILSKLFAQFEMHVEGLKAASVAKSRWPRVVQRGQQARLPVGRRSDRVDEGLGHRLAAPQEAA